MRRIIDNAIKASIKVKEALRSTQEGNIERAAEIISSSLTCGGKLLIFGNGGSAADSQHIAAELVGRFKRERRAMAAIALTTNTSTLTAIANDYGYDAVFGRQIEALGKPGDVALGISTSGNSRNVIAALKKARAMGLETIALTGCKGGKMKACADLNIVVASSDTPRIQEAHALVGHILCDLVERKLSD